MNRSYAIVLALLVLPCLDSSVGAQAVTDDGLTFELADDGELTGLSYCGDGGDFSKILESRLTASKSQAVQSVTFVQHHIVASEIEAIGRMKSVSLLQLGYYPDPVTISDAAVRRISMLSGLEELSGNFRTPPDTPWEALGELQKLQILSLTGDVTLKQKALEAIGTLPKLIHLEIDGCLECDDFRWLAALKTLNSVNLRSGHINPGVFDAIKDLPSLKSVELRGSVLGMEHLRLLPHRTVSQLQLLELEVAADVTAETLARFSSLQTLILYVPGGTRFDLALVRKLPKLETLSVHGTALSAVSQLGICDHPTLKHVQLTDSAVGRVIFSEDCKRR